MSDAIAISVQNISKAYRIWERPAARLTSPLIDAAGKLTGIRAFRQQAAHGYRDFWALKDISFEVRKGESVGIIGRNGSGKSTLLQIIAGTLQPTVGAARVDGRVAALLELGSGFNPDFTGRENVFLNGTVLGLTRREMEARFDEIAAFADIGDFIDQPIKTYSSGMMVRLAFAVQTAVEPEILIVDEALSVGDFFFQQKCFKRIAELRARGTTFLFVSHDLGSVRSLCERTLYLKHGRTVLFGETQPVVAAYYAEGADPAAPAPGSTPDPAKTRAVSASLKSQALWWADATAPSQPALPVQLVGLIVCDDAGRPCTRAKTGHVLHFKILFRAAEDGQYHAALELKNRYDQIVTSLSSYTSGLAPIALKAGQTATLDLAVNLNFEGGRYSAQVLLAVPSALANRAARLDSSPWVGPIEVTWDYENERAPFLGMFGPQVQARFLHETD